MIRPGKHIAIGFVLASTLLSGCATTGSVKRAQGAAEAAMIEGKAANAAAGQAQGSADSAAAAARQAQGSADSALALAQGAMTQAQAAAAADMATAGKVAALERRLHRLERWKRAHAHATKHSRRHHHKVK